MAEAPYDDAAINALGRNLQALRARDESALLIGLGALAPSIDCHNGSMSATVQKGGETATSEAVNLQDAILLARGKVNDQIAAKIKAAEKAKKEALATK